ncbi:hypothetical protein SLE2022_275690 [Rubroshorea leprosula]
MGEFRQYLQGFKASHPISEMDISMEMTKQPSVLNHNIPENFNVADFFLETLLAHQQPDFLASRCIHNNLLSTLNSSCSLSAAPAPPSIMADENVLQGSNKRKAMEQSTSGFHNISPAVSTSEFGGNISSRKKNRMGKGRRGRSNQKDPEKSDEVVHVRARRGQATDSHSLAERVRREKINEKMRCLQDLVPGCHKTKGMAVMLEEIINYVHSLQNQVEFLSMELAAACSSYDLKAQGTSTHEARGVEKWARDRYGEQNSFHSTWPL